MGYASNNRPAVGQGEQLRTLQHLFHLEHVDPVDLAPPETEKKQL
jgi:hypothetical protein